MEKQKKFDWFLRFIKGMFIGSGFILPGVSGGALAAVFGIYERIIDFLANIKENFKKNVLYFIPVGLGAATGIFILSIILSFLFKKAETQILWFFIGCIIGTLPALYKQANKKGHKSYHYIIFIVSFIFALAFLYFGSQMLSGNIPLNFGTWLLGGAIIGIGVLVPGLSPSNFLLYLGMYDKMTDGIKSINLMVIIPLGLGVVICLLLLAKLMAFILKKAYTGLLYFILGVVFASTIMIIPFKADYGFVNILLYCILGLLGVALGLFMGRLEEKYKVD